MGRCSESRQERAESGKAGSDPNGAWPQFYVRSPFVWLISWSFGFSWRVASDLLEPQSGPTHTVDMSEMQVASDGHLNDDLADSVAAELHSLDIDAEGTAVSPSEDWNTQLEKQRLKQENQNMRHQLEQERNIRRSLQKQLQQEHTTSSGLREQLRQARAGNARPDPVIPLNAVYVQTASLDPTRFEQIRDAIMGVRCLPLTASLRSDLFCPDPRFRAAEYGHHRQEAEDGSREGADIRQ